MSACNERDSRADGAELLEPDELLRAIGPIPVADQDWSWVRRSHLSFERNNKEIERSPWLRAAAAVRAAAWRGDPAPPLIGAPLRQCG
jgi:hypothetical protein